MKVNKTSAAQIAAIANQAASRAAEDREGSALRDKAKTPNALKSESFIASVVAARRPPPMALDDTAPNVAGASASAVFKSELDSFSRKGSDDVAADFAKIFLNFSDAAQAEGDPALDAAFDLLGETMVNYEHLRLLRTGQLG